MTRTQVQFMSGLAHGPAIFSATERGNPEIRELIDGGLVETWLAGPIVGVTTCGECFAAVRLTDKGEASLHGAGEGD